MTDTDDYRRPPIMQPRVDDQEQLPSIDEMAKQWNMRGIRTTHQTLSGEYSRRNAAANRGE